MFKITSCIISTTIKKNRSMLIYRQPIDIRLCLSSTPLNFKYKNPTERDTCKIPPPPPPPPPKNNYYLWGALALAVTAGSFAVYAKHNPEVRDWLTIYAPWYDELIAFAYQENVSYGEYVTNAIDDFNKFLNEQPPLPPCTVDGKLLPVMGPVEAPKKRDDDEGEDEPTPCDKLQAPVGSKDICTLEDCLKDLGNTAVLNYKTARDACIYYNKLIEEGMMDFTIERLKELPGAMEERIKLVKESVDNASKASTKLAEWARNMDCGVVDVKNMPKEAVATLRGTLKDFQDKIKRINIQYQWENDKSLALDLQWQRVNEAVTKYTDEIQTMFPGLKYDSKKPHVPGNGDILLYHSLRYVNKLKAELEDALTGMTERVNRGIESLPQGERDKLERQLKIQATYRAKLSEMDKEYKKRANDQKQASDKLLQKSLKMQLERSQETLVARVEDKEKEAASKLNNMVAGQVAAEKKIMEIQRNEMAMKVKVVEDKLNAKLKAERETRRSQELWTAGASLLAATKKGEPYVKVEKELNAIKKASGDGDKLVQTVLKAIPDSVRKQGLVPESVLRERFRLMEKMAMKVALVEQEGAPLPVYFVSWLQYLLLFMRMPGIPQDEIDKPPKEPPTGLDTFDLLQRARFWIERGNIAFALRYVSSLEGASRGAAGAWSEAARSHLETRQAAEAVIAHAVALGLQYI